MRNAERELINSGKTALSLMEDAAGRIAQAIIASYPQPGYCVAYLGKGNNAGDALAVLGLLQKEGWIIAARCAYNVDLWSELPKIQYNRISSSLTLLAEAPTPIGGKRLVLLDGLLGLGAQLPLSPEISALCNEMNDVRLLSGLARTWSVDIPTGLDADTGATDPHGTVIADYTCVIGTVKAGMILDTSTEHIGRIVPIHMPNLNVEGSPREFVLESRLFARLLRPRPYNMYKNQAGHVAVIAGSVGMLGAAKLCSEAALRAGAGLVTLYALRNIYPLLAGMVAPEIIVKMVDSYDECKLDDCDALLIGPGLGDVSRQASTSIGLLLRNFHGPIVLDADGLKLVASEKLYLRENVLVTPHPGEMGRFLPQAMQHKTRAEITSYFIEKHSAAVLYKGSRSIITQNGSPLYYNCTGGPSMATAGQGDVLAGVCAGLCAQGVTPLMAGCMGAYLCGLASETQIANGMQTERTLTAGDTLNAIPSAMIAMARAIM